LLHPGVEAFGVGACDHELLDFVEHWGSSVTGEVDWTGWSLPHGERADQVFLCALERWFRWRNPGRNRSGSGAIDLDPASRRPPQSPRWPAPRDCRPEKCRSDTIPGRPATAAPGTVSRAYPMARKNPRRSGGTLHTWGLRFQKRIPAKSLRQPYSIRN